MKGANLVPGVFARLSERENSSTHLLEIDCVRSRLPQSGGAFGHPDGVFVAGRLKGGGRDAVVDAFDAEQRVFVPPSVNLGMAIGKTDTASATVVTRRPIHHDIRDGRGGHGRVV